MVLWTLDTCGFDATNQNCQVEMERDSWTFITFVRQCPTHSGVPNTLAGFNSIYQENVRGKSNVLKEILDNAPTSMFDIDAKSGERVFKQDIVVTWSWSGTFPNRILTITVTGVTLTTNQKNSIIAKLDSRFGIGKVIII